MKLIEDVTVTVRIDCRKCSAKQKGCHRQCVQMAAVKAEDGKKTVYELIQKRRRAYKHKNVDMSFRQFEKEVQKNEVLLE
ncbi:MAG: hypothetical protein IKJ88_05565 [Clostridia bacterium]|nr:hypothetical protein [Clostridia bacterium]